MRVHHKVLGSARDIAGTVYGTIVVMSVIAAGSSQHEVDAARLAGLVPTTALVFWFAHLYSHALDVSVRTQTRLTEDRLVDVARHEAAIPLAAVAPTLALVAGALGLVRESTSVWVALGFGVATLGAVGARYATIERLPRGQTLAAIGLNLALGLVIVALKAGLSH